MLTLVVQVVFVVFGSSGIVLVVPEVQEVVVVTVVPVVQEVVVVTVVLVVPEVQEVLLVHVVFGSSGSSGSVHGVW